MKFFGGIFEAADHMFVNWAKCIYFTVTKLKFWAKLSTIIYHYHGYDDHHRFTDEDDDDDDDNGNDYNNNTTITWHNLSWISPWVKSISKLQISKHIALSIVTSLPKEHFFGRLNCSPRTPTHVLFFIYSGKIGQGLFTKPERPLHSILFDNAHLITSPNRLHSM